MVDWLCSSALHACGVHKCEVDGLIGEALIMPSWLGVIRSVAGSMPDDGCGWAMMASWSPYSLCGIMVLGDSVSAPRSVEELADSSVS